MSTPTPEQAARVSRDSQDIAEALRELVRATKTADSGTPIDPTKLTTEAVQALAAQLRREAAAARELIETRLNGMDQATKLVADQVAAYPEEAEAHRDHLRQGFDRDIAAVRDTIRALREILETRIGAIDRASKLLADGVDKIPSDITLAVASLREILGGEIRNVQDVSLEKFTAIEGTFASNALALTAALAAQKEAAAEQNKSNTLAITKSEQATKETIAANAAQTTAGLASQAATIGDLKERVVRLESGGVAEAKVHTEVRADATYGQTDRIAAQAALKAQISMAIAGLAVLATIVTIILLALKK